MNYRIKPMDTIFFRDGKPFTMGEDTWADALFPPNPSTFLGVFRSAYFAQNPAQLEYANVRKKDPTLGLKIKSFFLEQGNELLLPVPLDCVVKEMNEEEMVILPKAQGAIPKGFSSTAPFLQNLKIHEELVETPKGYLWLSDFTDIYLAEKEEAIDLIKTKDLYVPEVKLGIGRDRSKRVAGEGQLFRVPFQRWNTGKDSGITAAVVNLEWGDSLAKNLELNLLRIGGEGKCALAEASELLPQFPAPEITNKCFKLYLATPAIFEHGFLPFPWNRFDKTLEGNLSLGKDKTVKVKLLQAFIGKFKNIGGFDMKKRCPKPMYRAVPEGSVYYFEIMDDTAPADVVEALHMQCISQDQERSNEGLGYAILGSLKKTDK